MDIPACKTFLKKVNSTSLDIATERVYSQEEDCMEAEADVYEDLVIGDCDRPFQTSDSEHSVDEL